MTIINEKVIEVLGTGISRVVAEIAVSTADQIPAANGIAGRELCQGSMVHVIREGIVAKLDDNGRWYDVYGVEVDTSAG